MQLWWDRLHYYTYSPYAYRLSFAVCRTVEIHFLAHSMEQYFTGTYLVQFWGMFPTISGSHVYKCMIQLPILGLK